MTSEEILTERREGLRRSNKQQYHERANIWVQSANETEAKIRNFLFTFAIFLFTFSPVGIIKETARFNRNQAEFIWLLLSLSLLTGLIHLYLELKFYSKTKELTNRLEGIWSRYTYPNQKEFKSMLIKSKKIKKDMPKRSSPYPLIFQAAFTIIAFGMILLLHWGWASVNISTPTSTPTPSHAPTPTLTPAPTFSPEALVSPTTPE